MKIIKKLSIKKIFKLLRKGTFKKNIFFILFGMYFSTLAIASTLSVQFIGALIPGIFFGVALNKRTIWLHVPCAPVVT